ncbi:MAG: LTA synthase family protein, partial [Thiothrix sp.]
VNQAKFKALKEPLVFSDIYLYLQVFTHPRLFLPFLNIPLTLVTLIIGLSLLYLAVTLEPTLKISSVITNLIVLGVLLILTNRIIKIASGLELNFTPSKDIKVFGFFNSLAIYLIQALQKPNLDNFKAYLDKHSPYKLAIQSPAERPNLVVIQSESFFDPRPLSASIKPEVLQFFDKIKALSIQNGKLNVPAWGANTLRSEYAFLSGIANQELSYYQFNPYQFLQKTPSMSIASYLKCLGYRCICIHPNHAAFFKRDKVFPLIGFDEFIDIHGFESSQTSGPYISDQAVSEKIQTLLKQNTDQQPLFIFAITMENHGPLHLENRAERELNYLYGSIPPRQHHDLTIYLKHLKNADRMLLNLTDSLKTRTENTWLCWYGDHIPSMPAVYQEINWQDGRSDYLIWNNKIVSNRPIQKELSIEQLGISLLIEAGLTIANKS